MVLADEQGNILACAYQVGQGQTKWTDLGWADGEQVQGRCGTDLPL